MSQKRRNSQQNSSGGPASTASVRRDWTGPIAGPAVLLAGIGALKGLVLFQLVAHPLLQPDAGLDTTAYVDLARKVIGGNVALAPGLYFVSPLYIYFLAAGLAVFDSFTAVRIVQIALGTLSVAFLFFTTRAWFGVRAAWSAAILGGLTGLFTFYEVVILQAAIDAVMTSAALFTLTLALAPSATAAETGSRLPSRRARRRMMWFAIAGALFGLQALNRPNVLIACAGIAAALLIVRRRSAAALLVAGLVVGLAPVFVRNVIVGEDWSVVSSHGGLNFYIGNGEGATGFYRQIPGITPTIAGQERDARRVAEQAAGRPLTDAETSDYFFELAWKWIRQHPGEALGLYLRKLAYVFSAQHVALPHSYPFYAYDEGTALRFCFVGPWLLVPLGLAGLAFAAPQTQRGEYFAWVAFVPCYAAAVALFFIAERYRLPLLVPLCAGAGAAIDALWRELRQRRFAPLALPAAVFAVLAVLVNWPVGLHDGRWEEGLRLAQRLVIMGRYEEADARTSAVAPREPRPGATKHGVGAQLLRVGQGPRAVRYLREAQQADPENPTVAYALGQALLQTGQANEALPHLRRGFESGSELPGGGYDLAAALQAAGDLRGAADAIRRVRPAEDDVEGWLRAGRLAAQVRALEEAEAFFRHAVEIRPYQASARLQRGLNLLVLGRYSEAERELSEAVRLDPDDADSLAHLALCEFKLGRFAQARSHASAALAIDGANALALELAEHLRRAG